MKYQLNQCANELEHREQSQQGLSKQLSDTIFWLNNRNKEIERIQAELTDQKKLLDLEKTRNKFEVTSDNSMQSFFLLSKFKKINEPFQQQIANF